MAINWNNVSGMGSGRAFQGMRSALSGMSAGADQISDTFTKYAENKNAGDVLAFKELLNSARSPEELEAMRPELASLKEGMGQAGRIASVGGADARLRTLNAENLNRLNTISQERTYAQATKDHAQMPLVNKIHSLYIQDKMEEGDALLATLPSDSTFLKDLATTKSHKNAAKAAANVEQTKLGLLERKENRALKNDQDTRQEKIAKNFTTFQKEEASGGLEEAYKIIDGFEDVSDKVRSVVKRALANKVSSNAKYGRMSPKDLASIAARYVKNQNTAWYDARPEGTFGSADDAAKGLGTAIDFFYQSPKNVEFMEGRDQLRDYYTNALKNTKRPTLQDLQGDDGLKSITDGEVADYFNKAGLNPEAGNAPLGGGSDVPVSGVPAGPADFTISSKGDLVHKDDYPQYELENKGVYTGGLNALRPGDLDNEPDTSALDREVAQLKAESRGEQGGDFKLQKQIGSLSQGVKTTLANDLRFYKKAYKEGNITIEDTLYAVANAWKDRNPMPMADRQKMLEMHGGKGNASNSITTFYDQIESAIEDSSKSGAPKSGIQLLLEKDILDEINPIEALIQNMTPGIDVPYMRDGNPEVERMISKLPGPRLFNTLMGDGSVGINPAVTEAAKEIGGKSVEIGRAAAKSIRDFDINDVSIPESWKPLNSSRNQEVIDDLKDRRSNYRDSKDKLLKGYSNREIFSGDPIDRVVMPRGEMQPDSNKRIVQPRKVTELVKTLRDQLMGTGKQGRVLSKFEQQILMDRFKDAGLLKGSTYRWLDPDNTSR